MTTPPQFRRKTLFAALLACSAHAVQAGSAAGEAQLGAVVIEGAGGGGLPANLPANSSGYSAKEIYEQVNVINTEDIVKYSPDTMTRKRYIGDRNAIIETRTASVTASARSLVYADGVLLSNFLGNSYSYPPRWNLVSPEEIQRVDFFFGPHAAAYPGNSIGTTVFMTTRMPEQFEAHAKVQVFAENFSLYGHGDTYSGNNVSVVAGARADNGLSWLVGYNRLHSHGHPMQYAQLATSATKNPYGQTCAVIGAACTGTTPTVSGAVTDTDLTGAPRTLIGAFNLDDTKQDAAKLKLGYDITPTLHLRYTLAAWQNDTFNHAQSFVSDAAGNTVANSASGFIKLNGSNYYLGSLFAENTFRQEHWMHALTLKSDTRSAWDWEAVASIYKVAKDEQHTSNPGGSVGPGVGLARTAYYGQVAINPYGDGWQTLDLKGYWRPAGAPGKGEHELSFGYHFDRYKLDTQTYFTTSANDASWQSSNSHLQLAAASTGQTQTQALFAQEAWKFQPGWKLIAGGRYEQWQATNGSNTKLTTTGAGVTTYTTTLAAGSYGDRSENYFSPKLALEYELNDNWLMKGALSRGYRMPTVAELFQALTAGNSIVVNNPALRPENAVTAELTAERALEGGLLRLSLFEEHMRDALYSQTAVVAGVGTMTAIQNVDRVRTDGITVAYQQNDVGMRGLDLTGSLTYARSRTLENAANRAYEGKVYPGVPDWRATLVATYHQGDRTTYSLAARYSGYQANTLDNTDINQTVYGANSRFFVVDARVTHKLDKNFKAAFGIDNLNNEKYYAYHPMPQRTLFAELKYDF